MSLRYPHQAQHPDDEERGLTQAALRPGQPAPCVALRSKGDSVPETGPFQNKPDPMTGQLTKVPYTPRSVLGANPKSLAEVERAKAYYQTHREKLREAKARQHKYALDRGRVDL